MSKHIRNDKFLNDYIWKIVEVVSIWKKMTKVRLIWFRHVQRRLSEVSIRKIDQIIFLPMRRDGRISKRILG